MEVNMQDAHFELPHPLSPAHLKMLHLNPQSPPVPRRIRNRQSAKEDV
jgi:hypothetical protein